MKALVLIYTTLLMTTLTAYAQPDKQESAKLIEVAQFGHYQPIGVAVTQTGRIFITFPRHMPYEYGVAELVNGQRRPYPDAEWNKYDSTQADRHFVNAQAAWPDDQNNLWILDPANPMDGTTIPTGVKLLKINLSNNQVEHVYRFEDLPREKIALNDVRIDTKRQLAYLSEPKTSSIIILDLKTGKSRQVLQEDKSTKAEPGFKLHLDGKDVVDDRGKAFSSNVNGIALTHDFKYFYFRAINQTKLYRIAVDYLANRSLTDAELSKHVELVSETGISHGMIADSKGNVYLTDSPNKAIRYVTSNGHLETLVQDKRLIWPDTFAIGPDGYLYLTCSQINRAKKYNHGENKVEYPFRLFKVKLP
ncbi:gluconolactonase [Mucilaginibacter robiniae]|uniref:Gluconolactonase n=1 Tax=Mucilaginibacter robiniae TaxID=2728022 RepID=A0A7L5DZX8_9SPHI|nr:L-dopachrome tautomerase-related protein [Mucilaginibacter robiniae]QJD94834.1 gluconolactonase [Mucilaginibacter robiniae]